MVMNKLCTSFQIHDDFDDLKLCCKLFGKTHAVIDSILDLQTYLHYCFIEHITVHTIFVPVGVGDICFLYSELP